jgi:hypothetical protein
VKAHQFSKRLPDIRPSDNQEELLSWSNAQNPYHSIYGSHRSPAELKDKYKVIGQKKLKSKFNKEQEYYIIKVKKPPKAPAVRQS